MVLSLVSKMYHVSILSVKTLLSAQAVTCRTSNISKEYLMNLSSMNSQLKMDIRLALQRYMSTYLK